MKRVLKRTMELSKKKSSEDAHPLTTEQQTAGMLYSYQAEKIE